MAKRNDILLPANTGKLFRVKPGQLAKAIYPKFGLVDYSSMSVARAEQLLAMGFTGIARKPIAKEKPARKVRKKIVPNGTDQPSADA